MIDRLTRALLPLRAAGPFVTAEDRPWLEALAAEADDVAPGRARLVWVLGSVAVVTRSPAAARWFGYALLSTATAVAVVGLSWYPGVDGPAATANRVQAVATMTVLLLLLVTTRAMAGFVPRARAGLTSPPSRVGMAGASGLARTTRMVRFAGLAGVWAL